MNKSNFFSLSFLTGAVALLLPGMAQKCQAQADFDNCLPPKVIHHFGFEDAVKDDFADDTLTIGDLAVYADNFCYAVQLPATEGEGGDAEAAIEFLAERDYLHMMPADSQLSAEAIATRAQVAYLLTAICMEP